MYETLWRVTRSRGPCRPQSTTPIVRRDEDGGVAQRQDPLRAVLRPYDSDLPHTTSNSRLPVPFAFAT